jgi:glycerophosphoryl diester phosphodiesterase
VNPFLRGRAHSFAIVGHRGAMGLAPENTLESFELAFDQGATMVELDVHPTRDGKLVVHHDDRVGRTTTGPLAAKRPFVSDLTLEEIRSLDAGSWFVAGLERPALPPPHGPTPEERRRHFDASTLSRYASGQVKTPTLEAVLALVRSRGAMVNVELKMIPRFYAGLTEAAVALVRRLGMEESVVFSSFDHQAVARAKRLAPGIAGGVLEVSRLHEPGRYVEAIGADAWNPGCVADMDSIGFASVAGALDRASVAEAHEHGVSVFPWTENDPVRQTALIEIGVDGVITDFPSRLAALARLAAPPKVTT